MRGFYLLCTILLVGVGGVSNARCFSRADLYPSCRYPAGDSWCTRHSYKPYAYRDSCLRAIRRPHHSNSNKVFPTLVAMNSLRQGMRYSVARRILLDGGWQGIYHRWQDIPSSGRVHNLYYENKWHEVVNCAGTGLGQCEFEFTDMFGNSLEVITVGDCIEDGSRCDLRVGHWSVKLHRQ